MKILVVDDDKDSLRAMEMVLGILGHEYEGTNDPMEALIKYQEHNWDVVITDVRMPILNGFQFAACIRKLNPIARIIFMSGYLNADEEQLAIAKGMYLNKPFDVKELDEIIDSLQVTAPEIPLGKR